MTLSNDFIEGNRTHPGCEWRIRKLSSSNKTSAIALTQWWQGFADEELNRLLSIALEQNQSLAAAEANVARAWAIAAI